MQNNKKNSFSDVVIPTTKLVVIALLTDRCVFSPTTALPNVKSPTLLLVGELDTKVIELNQQAYNEINCKKELAIIPGASHLFEEPGTLEEVTDRSQNWFLKYLYQFEKEIEKDFF